MIQYAAARKQKCCRIELCSAYVIVDSLMACGICRDGYTVGMQGTRWARTGVMHGRVASQGAVAVADAIYGA